MFGLKLPCGKIHHNHFLLHEIMKPSKSFKKQLAGTVMTEKQKATNFAKGWTRLPCISHYQDRGHSVLSVLIIVHEYNTNSTSLDLISL